MKNFFKGLSLSQLLAGALAAVTSFFLSAKIGIAGSVIGVAVASIVSTSASQIYKNVLDASSKKLQDAAQAQLRIKGPQGDASDAGDGDGGDDADGDAGSVGEDTERIPADRGKDGARPAPRSVSSTGTVRTGGNARALPTRHDRRVAIVVAAVSGLVAVGVTAGIILALTDGKGTDGVVRDIVHPTMSTEERTPVNPTNEPTTQESATPGQSAGQTAAPSATPSDSSTAATDTGGSSSQPADQGTTDGQGTGQSADATTGTDAATPTATPSVSPSADGDGTGSGSDGTDKDSGDGQGATTQDTGGSATQQ